MAHDITDLISLQTRHLSSSHGMSAVDAQTLALIDEGMVFSWGDGYFGKLGRGGNEGCAVPANLEKFEWNGYDPVRVVLSSPWLFQSQVWIWGQGDYYNWDMVLIDMLGSQLWWKSSGVRKSFTWLLVLCIAWLSPMLDRFMPGVIMNTGSKVTVGQRSTESLLSSMVLRE